MGLNHQDLSLKPSQHLLELAFFFYSLPFVTRTFVNVQGYMHPMRVDKHKYYHFQHNNPMLAQMVAC
jgi:hypothetical protein